MEDDKKQKYMELVINEVLKAGGNQNDIDWVSVNYCYCQGESVLSAVEDIMKMQEFENKYL